MIRLTCTQCKSVLEMDDAFAGGVCRCQHCGTIQTVPSHLKGSAVGAGTGQKSIYQGAGAVQAGNSARQSATGLYELADAVASSGLSRSGLSKPAVRAPAAAKAATQPAGHTLLLIGIGAGGVIAILAGIVVWLIVAKGTPQPQATPGPSLPVVPSSPVPDVDATPKPPVAPQTPAGPHFMTVPIDAGKIVYVIDRGQSAKQTLDTVKAALFNSIKSLGSGREFAVVFWGKRGDKDLKQWSFPEQGMARGTPQQAENVGEKFADLQAFGASDVSAAIKQAFALKPDVVFLVTAKGINLDESLPQAVQSARKNSDAKIYTIDLADGAGRKFLEPIAKESHGSYTGFSPLEVKPD